MYKKLSLDLLVVLLILTLVACGTSKDSKNEGQNKNPPSSEATSGDPTQDYDDDEFAETPVTNEDLEDLWNEVIDNAKPEISVGSSSTGFSSKNESTAGSSSQGSSSVESSSTGSSSEAQSSEATSSEDEGFKGTGTIGKVPGAIF